MDGSYTCGKCLSMCPIEEVLEREREGLLHKFEILEGTENNRRPKADHKKVIKCFKRSAVGQLKVYPTEIRPFNVLMNTINYLYHSIFPKHKENSVVVYHFMFDRFRSIRQDMVIQNLPPNECVQILEPIARFHIFFSYFLIEENTSNFDAHINNSHLQECLKKLLVFYDSTNKNSVIEGISSISLEFSSKQWDIECTYQLFNLGNLDALSRGVKLSATCPTDVYKKCILLSLAWYLKNYVHILNNISQLPLLLLLAVVGHIPEIRKHSLMSMSVAYSSPKSAYPLSHLASLLLHDNIVELTDECKHFELQVVGDAVSFLKHDFNSSVAVIKLKKMSWINERINECNVIDLLCYGKYTS